MHHLFLFRRLGAVAILLAFAAGALGNDRPNILLITADDLGLQLSCYGDTVANTPNIDRLADQSVRFQTAYVSQASCSPSRSSMFTGLYPHGNGQYGLLNANLGFRVHEPLVDALLPNVLKGHGYRTGIIGKLHVGPEKAFAFDMRHGEGFGGRDVRLQIDFAREFLTQSGDEPWFLMFNLFDPHVARQRLPDGRRGPQFFPDSVKGLPTKVLGPDDVAAWPWQRIDTPEQRQKIAGYYNCVHRIDAAIGMLESVLQQTGNWDNTLIVFLGDHGPPFTRGKTSCYESGLRVPFLVRWPGVSQPHASDRLVSSVDIYPTIMDAAGIELPSPMHGRSLRGVLKTQNEPSDWRSTLVGEFHFHGATPFFPRRAITDGRYKLIHNLRASETTASESVDGDRAYAEAQTLPEDHPAREAMQRLKHPPEWELYDLETDPVEFQIRAGDAELANIQSRLQLALQQWQEQTEDPFVDAEFRKSIEERYKPSP
ncbi:Arylsulfatase [Stieleria neptunia]|uniref:Arylsulfatase n=1 Tax=Stieleria neptunia TaxID=2527979 RepID=A0A518HIA7_9BACT|nr:sulfatase [Stieleria neptunia]QDV40510.1 Arylsulfatase [Stieleria neptunia]